MEKAILIHIATDKHKKFEAQDSMQELKGLTMAAGAKVVQEVFQFRSRINPKYLIGAGKVNEIIQLKKDLQTDLIIFDQILSPIQQRMNRLSYLFAGLGLAKACGMKSNNKWAFNHTE